MSAAIAAAAAAACCSSKSSNTSRSRTHHNQTHQNSLLVEYSPVVSFSRYEAQKRRDWNTFLQYLSHHRPLLALACCSAAHVLEFLKYLDQFGNTKLHALTCPFFGRARHSLPAPCCPCPRKQDWGSLDALVGRLRVAFEENGGQPLINPFAAPAVRLYIRDVRDDQAKARGIGYEKKMRNNNYNYSL